MTEKVIVAEVKMLCPILSAGSRYTAEPCKKRQCAVYHRGLDRCGLINDGKYGGR